MHIKGEKVRKLRVGILLGPGGVPRWAVEMLEQIRDSDYACLSLLVEGNGHPEMKDVFSRFNQALYLWYLRLDRKRCKPSPDALAQCDTRQIFPETALIEAQPIRQDLSCTFTDADVEKIIGCDLDILVNLGFRRLRGRILHAARYGTWTFQPGEAYPCQGGPVGFWEVYDSRPETILSLHVLHGDEEGDIQICRIHTATDYISVTRNENKLLWIASALLPRKIRELHALGEKVFFEKVRRENNEEPAASRKPSAIPKGYQTLRLLFKTTRRHFAKKIWKRIGLKQWILMYSFDNQGMPSSDLAHYHPIIPPKDRLWADPHVIQKDGIYYVFIEELIYREGKGHISCLTIDQAGNFTAPRPVITQPYHLSYPFVFCHQDKYFMIPETSENRTIELYECIQFPDRWELVRVLMDNLWAVDATLHQKDGLWWLFTNIRQHEGTSDWDDLYLFSAPDLFSTNWRPHPMNPVVSDVRSARPAGRLFSHQERLYRPSQDSSRRYGYRIRINQVLTLNESEYEEICIGVIAPPAGHMFLAAHTVNSAGDLTVIDSAIMRFNLIH